MSKKPALKITNLHKIYAGGIQALKGIDLEIKQGDFFALLGPNGSGKTTTINVLGGPTKKTSGTLEVFGLDINKHRQETQMMMGIVSQEISADSFFTVNEILLNQSGYFGIRHNQKWIDEILEKLNLMEKKHSRTRALSGGMKRRLMVAKALVHKPKLLILDEPTAGVDIELRHNLWKYVQQLNKDGITILLTTHYLEEAETLCNRTAIMHKGKIVAVDSTKKLIKSFGSSKTLRVSLKKPLKAAPTELKDFAPQIHNHDLSLTFDGGDIGRVLQRLSDLNLEISDMDLQSQNLEDVFIELTYRSDE